MLQPVPRKLNRDGLGITEQQPFTQGADIWTAYEISWLNPKGLPQVAIADVEIDYRSENLIESKSFKLYLNSFNQSKFADFAAVEHTMREDPKCLCSRRGQSTFTSIIPLSRTRYRYVNWRLH